jgi:hypothetical protein
MRIQKLNILRLSCELHMLWDFDPYTQKAIISDLQSRPLRWLQSPLCWSTHYLMCPAIFKNNSAAKPKVPPSLSNIKTFTKIICSELSAEHKFIVRLVFLHNCIGLIHCDCKFVVAPELLLKDELES